VKAGTAILDEGPNAVTELPAIMSKAVGDQGQSASFLGGHRYQVLVRVHRKRSEERLGFDAIDCRCRSRNTRQMYLHRYSSDVCGLAGTTSRSWWHFF
jgi:uncharacterized ParB-like nuclease family protein